MQYQIENATCHDVDAMVGLLGELFAIEHDFVVAPKRQRRGLEMLLHDSSHATVLVARATDNANVIGMVTGQLVVSTAQGGPSVWVEDLIVNKSARGAGVGRAFLARLLPI